VSLIDALLRRGHLSERALVEAWQDRTRPAHLNQCDVCLGRLVGLTRWLDDVRQTADSEIEVAFPPERLVAQQHQILRRLEHLDRPARLLAFPQTARASQHVDDRHRRFWPGWVAAGVAAGLILGVATDRVVVSETAARRAAVALLKAPAAAEMSDDEAMLLQEEFSRPLIPTLDTIDQLTPSVVQMAAARGR
jgi:hypothetical protein